MIKYEKEITNLDEIEKMLNVAKVCRISLFDGDFPYIVPLCFGFNLRGGKLELFFRCEEKGKKMQLLKNNNNAAFEIDELRGMVKSDEFLGFSVPSYFCISGTGVVEVTNGIEKITGLDLIMKKYGEFPEEGKLPEQLFTAVTVLKLTVGKFCCKEQIPGEAEQ